MRRVINAIIIISALTATAAASGPLDEKKTFVPVYDPELTVNRASGKIEIDGRLDDPGWKGAARAGNFVEHNPGDQTEPDVRTEVMVA